jgi:hypothetical protein
LTLIHGCNFTFIFRQIYEFHKKGKDDGVPKVSRKTHYKILYKALKKSICIESEGKNPAENIHDVEIDQCIIQRFPEALKLQTRIVGFLKVTKTRKSMQVYEIN